MTPHGFSMADFKGFAEIASQLQAPILAKLSGPVTEQQIPSRAAQAIMSDDRYDKLGWKEIAFHDFCAQTSKELDEMFEEAKAEIK